jgi:hypothetical protein
MKICIFGNSVGFRIRPPRRDCQDLTYSEILESSGHRIRNVSKAAVMINEAFTFLEEEVITFFPDLVIIHFGIVEICYRRTFRWANNQAIENYYMNRFFRRPYVFNTPMRRVFQFTLRAFNSCTRLVSSLLGLRWQWLSTKQFLLALRSVVEVILKETKARIIIIGITPCSDRVEYLLKGSRSRIIEANLGMKEICEQFSDRMKYLDPESFIHQQNMADLVPDGIHFSAEGHRQLVSEINTLIERLCHAEERPLVNRGIFIV